MEAARLESLRAQIEPLAREAKAAARVLSVATTAKKDAVLRRVAAELRGGGGDAVLRANEQDIVAAEAGHMNSAFLDRLRLDSGRLHAVAKGIEEVIALPDPVGGIAQLRRLSNGLSVGRMRVPLGLIAMIYESRPNVTADAASLCLKSGNACLLRGGSEAFHSNQAFAAVFEAALLAEGLPPRAVTLVPTTDREGTRIVVGLEGLVDLVIPRGGEALIRFVNEHARMPVIQHYKGVCHVYVDADADFAMAQRIVLNAKAQRPGVCNALETLLVDQAIAQTFLPSMIEMLRAKKVEVRGDAGVRALVPDVVPANDADWDTEYLDLVLSVALVNGIDGALSHIEKHGTYHTEAIVTRDYAKAQRWLREVDASLVLVNASTRFNDGGQLGLGAEIGISTTKLHAYGPMGLEELCTEKWIALGEGQIRD